MIARIASAAATLSVALLVTTSVTAGIVPTASAALPALTVSVSCYSNPERTTIHNNRTVAITIRSVGSLYRPYSTEPFYVNRRLLGGRSVTFYTGSAASYASAFTLTRRFIYNDSVGSTEGARVVTTTGLTFVRRC